MLYRELAAVSTYIADTSHKLEEVLQMLCLKTMTSFKTDALVYTELDNSGVVTPRSAFGIDISDESIDSLKFSISEQTPFTDAIRENKIVWINTLPQWPKQYNKMDTLKLPKTIRTFITSPVEARGLPVGSLAVFSREKLQYEESIAQFIEAIAMILAGALLNKKSIIDYPATLDSLVNSQQDRSEEFHSSLREYQEPLTERQNLILKLISEGRTNAAIADVLGYSESLIRQETIRIYAKLGCSGRNEAAQIYLKSITEQTALAV
jgi:DNA-binding CsgD family transcriptional regulator